MRTAKTIYRLSGQNPVAKAYIILGRMWSTSNAHLKLQHLSCYAKFRIVGQEHRSQRCRFRYAIDRSHADLLDREKNMNFNLQGTAGFRLSELRPHFWRPVGFLVIAADSFHQRGLMCLQQILKQSNIMLPSALQQNHLPGSLPMAHHRRPGSGTTARQSDGAIDTFINITPETKFYF